LAQKKYDEAIEICEKALRLRQDNAETHAELAAALWNRGRINESILHGRKAVELNPDLLDAQFNLGWALFKNGNYDEAISHFEYVLRLDPDRQARAQSGGQSTVAESQPGWPVQSLLNQPATTNQKRSCGANCS
jgi:tetratricopeptide (TPR) repeat protein